MLADATSADVRQIPLISAPLSTDWLQRSFGEKGYPGRIPMGIAWACPSAWWTAPWS